MITRRRGAQGLLPLGTIAIALLVATGVLSAHEGPPFPIVTDRTIGGYVISVWTDPDSTDDGTAAGRFWVTLRSSNGDADVPAGTRVDVAIAPAERASALVSAVAEPVNGAVGNQLATLVMDHEGPFQVHVSVRGPLGPADLDTEVTATYDLRPPPFLMIVFVLPFVLIGFLWIKLILKRRGRPGTTGVV